jgi:hypothetical protein
VPRGGIISGTSDSGGIGVVVIIGDTVEVVGGGAVGVGSSSGAEMWVWGWRSIRPISIFIRIR